MFDFLKKDKNEKQEIRRESVNCICTLNKYDSRRCNLVFGTESIVIEFEDGMMEIPYDKLKRYGRIINDEYGVKDAMKNKILTPEVMQSPGFLAGNFYSFTNDARVFLYLKFEEERGSIHTFLAEYNNGVDKVIRFIKKQSGINAE